MTSRERVKTALAHKTPDRVPVDFGATMVTGMSASFIFKLRRALGFAEKEIKIICPYQMLGEVDEELREWMGVDIVTPWPSGNLFGFDNSPKKSFKMPDGTPVLVPEAFHTSYEKDGRLFMYAKGDRNYPPSAVMPSSGFYFDALIRQKPINEDELDPRDNLEEFALLTDEELRNAEMNITALYENTDYAIVGSCSGTAIGDIAYVPGPMLPEPEGIRDIEEWYISPLIRPDYVKEVFELQTELALKNLKHYHQAVGEKIDILYLCGADFGGQQAPLLSTDCFREFYLPYYKKLTGWIHENTGWKVFKHCCGAIRPLIPSLIEAGIDILNPVQCSASGMDAVKLKADFGDKLTFWGGGVDTQKTLPWGTVDEVRSEVKSRIDIFGKNGGYVFNTIHNTQANVPVDNFIAMIESYRSIV